jgi:hypothetical protein
VSALNHVVYNPSTMRVANFRSAGHNEASAWGRESEGAIKTQILKLRAIPCMCVAFLISSGETILVP